MTHEEQIIEYLQRIQGGIDDDMLSFATRIEPRQQVNAICRRLAAHGLVQRRKVDGKIQNFWVGGKPLKPGKNPTPTASEAEEA